VGFRTADGPPAAQAVLFIGDSFTQGFGVDANRTFPSRACDRLHERGIAVRCLNAGVTGFGTAHELRLLRKLLDRGELHVAAVVLQVLPSNDLRDNWEDGGFGVEGGRLVSWDPPHIPLPVRMRVGLLENRFARSSAVVKLAANAWMQGDGSDPHDGADAFELESRLLQEAVATARQHDVAIVVVVCATAWEVDRTARAADEARLDFVAHAVAKLDVPWLDSRTVVRSPAYYIPDDGHLSADGNALIGGAVADMLVPLVSR
jgi:lysophospholipase L1-like esterase